LLPSFSNKALYDAYVLDDTITEPPQGNRYIGLAIDLICNRLSTKGRFSGYTFRKDLVSDAIEHCIKGLHKFNPEKSDNPFAYFTQIAKNAFWQRINIERKENYLKYKNFSNQYLFSGEGEFETLISDYNEATNEIINSFEEEVEKKREKSKEIQNKKKSLKTEEVKVFKLFKMDNDE
jgi:DNA-directed RNA polymerase specialized sigma24 family protein